MPASSSAIGSDRIRPTIINVGGSDFAERLFYICNTSGCFLIVGYRRDT